MDPIELLLRALEPRRDISDPAADPGLIRKTLPELCTCLQRRGPEEADELRRRGFRTPAVFVDVAGFRTMPANAAGERTADVTFAAWVVTRDAARTQKNRDGGPLSRDDRARNIAVALTGMLREWDPADVPGVEAGEATAVAADKIWSGKLDDTGCAIWGVAWRQDVTLPAAAGPAGETPSELYVEWGDGEAERLIPEPREAA